MSSSLVKVSPATEADLLDLAIVRRLAFRSSPIYQRVWGQVADDINDQYRVKQFKQILQEDKVMMQNAELDGKIVGLGIWHLPGYREPEEEEGKEGGSDDIIPPGTEIELYNDLINSMKIDHGRDVFHLLVLMVHPDYQRRGVGQSILEWGFWQADQRNHSIFLESTEAGVNTYLKNRFYHIRDPLCSGPNGAFILYPMHRPSRQSISSPTSPFDIQPAYPSDIQSISELERRSASPSNQIDESSIAAEYERRLKDERLYMVFKAIDRKAGNVVGVTSWRMHLDVNDVPGANETLGRLSEDNMKGRMELIAIVLDPKVNLEGSEELRRDFIAKGTREAQQNSWRVITHVAQEKVSQALPTVGREPITLARATSEDLVEIARIRREAFKPSLIHHAIFGNVTRQAFDEFSVNRFRPEINNPKKAVWVARMGGVIVGFSSWHLPEPDVAVSEHEEEGGKGEKKDWVKIFTETFPAGSNYQLAADFFSLLGQSGGSKNRYLLGTLCIDPKYQGQGVGTALVRWGTKEADREGLDCFLDSSIVAIPVYKKAGFDMYGEPIKGGKSGELVLYPMRRRPLQDGSGV